MKNPTFPVYVKSVLIIRNFAGKQRGKIIILAVYKRLKEELNG